MSATTAACGWCWAAKFIREGERSLPIMKTEGLTARYLPLPQPTSRPIEPGGRCSRKDLMTGQAWWDGDAD